MSRIALLVLVTAASGCATTRVITLQELEPVTTPLAKVDLSGQTFAIKVTAAAELMDRDARGAVEVTTAPGYAFRPMTDDERVSWRDRVTRERAAGTKEDWTAVGWMRNGFGMHMANIYTTVPPGDFLASVLAMEIAAHGGTVTTDPAAADTTIEGHIRYMKVDIYMKYWADLVVDWTLDPAKGEPTRLSIHTRGERTSVSGAAIEFVQPLRMCEQDMVWQLVEALGAP